MRYVFLANLASTLFMTGLIWLVQLVQYPLFKSVGTSSFAEYHAGHSQRITWIVLPVMLVQLVSSILLVLRRPSGLENWMPWAGLVLVVIAWSSTAFFQVPQHTHLSRGFDDAAHSLLVTSNWLRTVAWTIHSIILLWALDRLLGERAFWA